MVFGDEEDRVFLHFHLPFKTFFDVIFVCSGLLLLRFSSCSEQGRPCVVAHGLLIAVASVVEHELWSTGSVAVVLGSTAPQYAQSFWIRD